MCAPESVRRCGGCYKLGPWWTDNARSYIWEFRFCNSRCPLLGMSSRPYNPYNDRANCAYQRAERCSRWSYPPPSLTFPEVLGLHFYSFCLIVSFFRWALSTSVLVLLQFSSWRWEHEFVVAIEQVSNKYGIRTCSDIRRFVGKVKHQITMSQTSSLTTTYISSTR
jgi:hypothetical protein